MKYVASQISKESNKIFEHVKVVSNLRKKSIEYQPSKIKASE